MPSVSITVRSIRLLFRSGSGARSSPRLRTRLQKFALLFCLLLLTAPLLTPSFSHANSSRLFRTIREFFYFESAEGSALLQSLRRTSSVMTRSQAEETFARIYMPPKDDIFRLYSGIRADVDVGLSQMEAHILRMRALKRGRLNEHGSLDDLKPGDEAWDYTWVQSPEGPVQVPSSRQYRTKEERVTPLTRAELAAALSAEEINVLKVLIHNRFRINQERMNWVLKKADDMVAELAAQGTSGHGTQESMRLLLARSEYKYFDSGATASTIAYGKPNSTVFFKPPRPFVNWNLPKMKRAMTAEDVAAATREIDSLYASINQCLKSRPPSVATADNNYYMYFDMARSSAFTTMAALTSEGTTMEEKWENLPLDLFNTIASTYVGTKWLANQPSMKLRIRNSFVFGQARSIADFALYQISPDESEEGENSQPDNSLSRLGFNAEWNTYTTLIPPGRYWLLSGLKCLYPNSKIVYWGNQVISVAASVASNIVYFNLRGEYMEDWKRMNPQDQPPR